MNQIANLDMNTQVTIVLIIYLLIFAISFLVNVEGGVLSLLFGIPLLLWSEIIVWFDNLFSLWFIIPTILLIIFIIFLPLRGRNK